MSARTPVLVRFPPALLARVDRLRGSLNRHAFLIDLIERGTALIQVTPQESPPLTDDDRSTNEGPGVAQHSEGWAEPSDPNPAPDLMAALEASLELPSDPEPDIGYETDPGAETDMGGDTPSGLEQSESSPSSFDEAGDWPSDPFA